MTRHATATGWAPRRERYLARHWLTDTPLAVLATNLECTERTVRNAAAKLNLGPRDPVQRALARGADREAVVRRDAALALPSITFGSITGTRPHPVGAPVMPSVPRRRHDGTPGFVRRA